MLVPEEEVVDDFWLIKDLHAAHILVVFELVGARAAVLGGEGECLVGSLKLDLHFLGLGVVADDGTRLVDGIAIYPHLLRGD